MLVTQAMATSSSSTKTPKSTARSHERPSSLDRRRTREFLDGVFGDDLHAKRVLSLANGVSGVLRAATLSIHAIGQAYAKLGGIGAKHGVKQVDRLLSNDAIRIEDLTPMWASFVLGPREEVVIALDWTEFDDDDHTTLCAYVVTRHGRATPLAWKTVAKSTLSERRNEYEDDLIERLHEAIPPRVRVVLLADRAFGDQKLYAYLEAIGWDWVIRFRDCIHVEHGGVKQPARDWLSASGRAKKLPGARVTADRTEVPAVVLCHAPKMKAPWALSTSLSERTAAEVVKLYGRRFTVEETFRDQKDLRFGLGLRATHIRDADRRDRLLLLAAVAQALLTLLGAASEQIGYDRMLKVNTAKKRTHSLFRQGLYWYDALPNLSDERLRPLMEAFDQQVASHAFFREIFGII